MEFVKNRKGVSPLIATIILIAVSIAIVGVIFFWLRGMIAENVDKFGSPIESQCDKVIFTASATGNIISVNNQGNIPIVGMNVKIKTNGKTLTKSIRKPLDGVISPGESDIITLEPEFLFASAQQKTVTPVIQGKGVNSGKISRYVCKTKAVDVG